MGTVRRRYLGGHKVKWVAQPAPNDVWMMGCKPENPDNPRCPAKQGPDHDFSASPMLAKRTNGREIVIIQSKSGMAYGFDPASVPPHTARLLISQIARWEAQMASYKAGLIRVVDDAGVATTTGATSTSTKTSSG
jgi:hypothetical protein